MESKKYTLNAKDVSEISKVIGWTILSGVVAVLISFTANLEVPAQYALIVPLVNTVLYTASKFIQGKL